MGRANETFPSSLNHDFDALILDLITEHRRVILGGRLVVKRPNADAFDVDVSCSVSSSGPEGAEAVVAQVHPPAAGAAELKAPSLRCAPATDVADVPISWPEQKSWSTLDAVAGVAPTAANGHGWGGCVGNDAPSTRPPQRPQEGELYDTESEGGLYLTESVIQTAIAPEDSAAAPMTSSVARQVREMTQPNRLRATGDNSAQEGGAALPIKMRTSDSHYLATYALAAVSAPATSPALKDDDVSASMCLSRVRGQFRRLTNCAGFEVFFAIMILTNAAMVGAEIDMSARDLGYEPKPLYLVAQMACNCAFLFEWICRVIAQGRSFFWRGPDSGWNWFDTITIFCSALAEVLTAISDRSLSSQFNPSNLRLAKSLRAMRLLRIARASRVFQFIRALRILVISVLGTLQSLVWAIVLMLGIFFLFATVLTQQVTAYRLEATDPSLLADADKFWGSLSTSMFTLFMSISGGVSWIEPLGPLQEKSYACVLVFSVFISFTYFAALNVVTGVFCEKAHQCALADEHYKILDMQEKYQHYCMKLEQLFHACDEDASGLVTLAEFMAHIDDDEVRSCFADLDIEITDALETFRLLDADHRGGVNLTELVAGSFKLKGHAKGIDVISVKHDVKILREDIRSIGKAVGELISEKSGRRPCPVGQVAGKSSKLAVSGEIA